MPETVYPSVAGTVIFRRAVRVARKEGGHPDPSTEVVAEILSGSNVVVIEADPTADRPERFLEDLSKLLTSQGVPHEYQPRQGATTPSRIIFRLR